MAILCKNRAMAEFVHPDRHHVAVLVRHGMLVMELGIVHRLFGQARSASGEPLYEVVTCTLEPGPVRTDTDVTIPIDRGPEVLAEADTVIVPASLVEYEPMARVLTPPLAAALERIRPGARIASICTGAFVLAAAGLLDGRRATTHWNDAEHFQRTFPTIDVDASVLFIDDGDVLTAAGAASGIDVCLHLIRRDHGSAVTNRVARLCVVPPWREGGQAQYIDRPVPAPAEATTAATRQWALGRLDRPISLSELAGHARMSVRTFSRRFREEVGMTSGQWLTRQRVEHARRLLETTDLPVDRVAAEAGFGTAASMRQHLADTIGVPPMAYRNTFRAAR
jgi:transcriptional regulator GlxA family with amidase domain